MSFEIVRQENEQCCEDIYRLLKDFAKGIEYRSWNNLTDWHTYAEDVMRAVLEPTLGCTFANTNISESNEAAIDLEGTDSRGMPMLVQVSSDSSRGKIQGTLDSLALASHAGHHLVFMFLVDRHPQYREDVPFNNPHGVEFDPTSDVLDIRTLMRLIRHHHDPDRCKVVLERLRGELRETDEALSEPIDDNVASIADHVNGQLKAERRDHQSFQLIYNSPIKALLPEGEVHQEGSIISNAARKVLPEGTEGSDPIPFAQFIRDSWKSGEQQHLFITGKGGIGKTVALLTFATEDNFLDRRVPAIYIPLYRLAKRKGKIIKYVSVGKYVRRTFGKPLATDIEGLSNKPWSEGPSVILLLDGHNELPHEVSIDFAEDIGKWAKRSGVQIVMTSRHTGLPSVAMQHLELNELTQEDVSAYLTKTGGTTPPSNSPLWDILTTPLMLKIYEDVAQFKERFADEQWLSFMEDSDSVAHLIWNYLQIELYKCTHVEPDRVRRVDYGAALLLALPYVCWKMERESRFEVDQRLLGKYVQYGCAYWNERGKPSSFEDMAPWLMGPTYDGNTHPLNASTQLWILTNERSLLNKKGIHNRRDNRGRAKTESLYVLMHQEFRDALAAMHLRNAAEVAIAAECMPSEFDEAFGEDTKNHLAEIVDDDLLDKLWKLNRLRNQWRPDGPQGITYGNATHNLLCMAQYRNSLSTYSFSGMDLRGMCLFNYRYAADLRFTFSNTESDFRDTWIDTDCFSGQGHRDAVNSICFSPDGRIIASGSNDGSVRLWNISNREEIAKIFSHQGPINSVCFSSDGRTIASSSNDGRLIFWDVSTGETAAETNGQRSWISSICSSPNGIHLISGSKDGCLRLWDTITHEVVAEMRKYGGSIRSVSFSPDGQLVAAGTAWGFLILWDTVTHKAMAKMRNHNGAICSVCFSPDGQIVATAFRNGTVRLWNVCTQELAAEMYQNKGSVRSVCFSPDGRYIASGSSDGTVYIWDARTHEEVVEMPGHGLSVNSISFSPDGNLLASGSSDSAIRLWNSLTFTEMAELRGSRHWIRSACFSPDSHLMAFGSEDGIVHLWDTSYGKIVSNICQHKGAARIVRFSPDGRFIACGTARGCLYLWDAITHKVEAELWPQGGTIRSAAFSSDGRVLALGSRSGVIRLWDTVTHKVVAEACVNNGWVRSICFSPDGHLIAAGYENGFVHLWDAHTLGEPVVLDKRKHGVDSVCFSPDGSLIATGSRNGVICLWDTSTHEVIARRRALGWILAIDFSPDGRFVATGSRNGDVCLWDTITLQRVTNMHGHSHRVNSVCFSPDGRLLASSSDDGTVRLWDARKHEKVETISPIYGIDLVGLDLSLAVMEDEDRKTLLQNGALVPPPGSAERARRDAEEEVGASAAATKQQKGTSSMPAIPDFKIGFTFRGTYKDSVVGPACEKLLGMGYARQDVFYYPWHQPLVGGVESAETLRGIYHDHCACVVVLLSPDYAEGNWTGNVEWRAVLDLVNNGGAGRICLLSAGGVDVGSIPGLYATSDIAIDVDGMSSAEVAQTIVDWIGYHSS